MMKAASVKPKTKKYCPSGQKSLFTIPAEIVRLKLQTSGNL